MCRSVHNTRIERLWKDLRQGVTNKWKHIFETLESLGDNDSLDVDVDGHIWLLHHIFLPKIRSDCELWVSTHNSHSLSVEGGGSLTPRARFALGMVNSGIYALPPEPYIDEIEDLNIEGVTLPQRLSNVHVSSFTNPFSQAEVIELNHRLEFLSASNLDNENMAITAWITGLNFYKEVVMDN